MQVDFDDNHRIAAYWLTYEENQDPDKMRKIDEDLLQKGKKGYLVGITASPSPQPLTWPEFAMAMESLDKRMDIWKYDQERRKKAEKEQQRKKSMSTSYYIFTEVKVNGEWLAINGKMTRLTPNAHTVISPTFRTDARQHFEKAYLQLKDDGHSFGLADISEELKSAITEWIDPEDSVRIAVDYARTSLSRRCGSGFNVTDAIGQQKHGNVGDIELTEDNVIFEAWDAKYGKPYLRDELEELRDKLLTHPDVRVAGFVVDSSVDMRRDIVNRKNELQIETGTEIYLLSFDEWVDYEVANLSQDQKNALGYNWIVALVESFAQRRLELAPIDEPCDAWINDLIRILER